jgi:hypothetical protein
VRLTACWPEPAAVASPSVDRGALIAIVAVLGCWSSRARSGAGERVVAEVGQDVTGLPDDLAGLG